MPRGPLTRPAREAHTSEDFTVSPTSFFRSRRGAAGRVRALAVASGLLAAVALVTPSAVAGPAGGTGMPSARLAEARSAMAEADIAGTAWYTDARRGTVVVTVDSRVTSEGIARIRDAVDVPPGALEINRTPGRFAPRVGGGQYVYAPGIRCTLGFNARNSAGDAFGLLAGHCTRLATT